jgi:hypothetical protein
MIIIDVGAIHDPALFESSASRAKPSEAFPEEQGAAPERAPGGLGIIR